MAIRSLKVRTRADAFENDIRKNGKRYGRYVYIAAVFGFLGYVANLFVGPTIWLQADGLVAANRIALGQAHEVQVNKIYVQPGQFVKKGALLGEVYSADVAKTLATLTAQYAETQAKQAELTVKLDVAKNVATTLDARVKEAQANVVRVTNNRANNGFVSDSFYGNAIREAALATQEKAKVEAERDSAQRQLVLLQQAQNQAQAAINDIRKRYNDGHMVAPEDGVVGAQIAAVGDVLQPGTIFADLFYGEKFVLAYLDTGTLYEVKPGDRVTVSAGFSSSEGTVKEILPITVQLPQEFQKAFKPRSRGQVAKIALDDARVFAHSNTVRVAGHKLIPGNDEITTTRVASFANQQWDWFKGRLISTAQAAQSVAETVRRRTADARP